MKSKATPVPQRQYQQKARALAAEATGARILDAFIKRIEEQWFEDVTLDVVAQDAGVTVQTVVRRFGGKAGLLDAARAHMEASIQVRRDIVPGNIDHTVDVLVEDYEAVGHLVLRLLGQEERHAVLKPVVDTGRRGHREWLAKIFAGTLDGLPSARRTATLDALVVATDIYVWKLVRLDMGRPVSAFKAMVKNLLLSVIKAAEGQD